MQLTATIRQKSYTGNGIAITYPAGYASPQAYLATLRLNLAQLRNPGKQRALLACQHMIPRYVANIAQAAAALA